MVWKLFLAMKDKLKYSLAVRKHSKLFAWRRHRKARWPHCLYSTKRCQFQSKHIRTFRTVRSACYWSARFKGEIWLEGQFIIQNDYEIYLSAPLGNSKVELKLWRFRQIFCNLGGKRSCVNIEWGGKIQRDIVWNISCSRRRNGLISPYKT